MEKDADLEIRLHVEKIAAKAGIPPEKVIDVLQDAAERGILPKKDLKFAQRARELLLNA
jgi:hypothetical protein